MKEEKEEQIQNPVNKPKKKKRHQFLVVTLILLIFLIVGQSIGNIVCGFLFGSVADSGWRLLLTFYLPFLFVDGLFLLYLYIAERPIFVSLKYVKRAGRVGNTVKMGLLGFAAGLVLNLICALIALLHGDITLSFGGFNPLFLLAALVVVLIQSAAEELLERAYMMNALGERYHVIFAILYNPFLFALMHLGNSGLTPFSLLVIFMAGLSLTFMTIATDGIYFPIMAHTSWNYSQNILLGLPNSGVVAAGSLFTLQAAKESIWYSPAFGLEGGLAAVLVWPVFSTIMLVIALRRKKQLTSDR